MAWPGSSSIIPDGFVICNGASLSQATYPELFAAIGTDYGGGGGNFNVPDYTGRFLRGLGGAAASRGTAQGDAIRNITGTFYLTNSEGGNAYGYFHQTGAFAPIAGGAHQNITVSGTSGSNWGSDFKASRIVPTAAENRPINYGVYYIIKY